MMTTEELLKQRKRELYKLHRAVLEPLFSTLEDDTDQLFATADLFLEQMSKLLNTYSIIAAYLKDDYLLGKAEFMKDLNYLVGYHRDKQKLRSHELHEYTKKMCADLERETNV